MDYKPSNYISDTSKEYAIYVAQTRAIPRVSDGLKDGQRKALWLCRNKSDKIKTVALAGSMIAEELFYHGDSSASETISALAAPYINNNCFLDGIGSFGSKLSPRAWGAPRYTYVKRNSAAQDILFSDLNIIPLADNYDGSNQSAETFLPLIPTVLLNGVSGVAVGWSTEILPHKLSDLVEACVCVLDNKKIKQLKPYYNNYDIDIENIENNSWTLKGKIKILDHARVQIQEIPPGLKIEKLKEHLDDLEEKEKIQNYIDKSTEEINLVVQFKRGTTKDFNEDQLIDLFKLKTRITERIVVLDWQGKGIRTYENPESLVVEFVDWRLGWFYKRYQNLLNIAKLDLNYALAIKECFDKKLPDQLRDIASKKELTNLVDDITRKFSLTSEEVDRIVSMPLYRWTKEHFIKIKEEIVKQQDLVKEYTNILKDEQKIKDIFKNELLDLKKKY